MGGSLFTILPSLVVIGTVGGNIMVFSSHVTLQDHMIKALNDFMVRRSPSRYATITTSLVVIGTVVVKILYI